MLKFSLFLLSFIYCSSFSFAQTKIIMSKDNSAYTIPCKVNGLPLKFAFDTSATDVTISLTEVLFMLKNGYLSKDDIGEKVNYGISNGEIAEGTLINIHEIEFAGLKLQNVKASVIHEKDAPLLLGQSAIEKLGQIQLNGNELTILNKDIKTNTSQNDQNSSQNEWKEVKMNSGNIEICYNTTPQYDFEIENEFRVNVGKNTDVVVKLMRIEADKEECIRIVFIKSFETFSMKNIPIGNYYLKVAFGKDFRQKIENNTCTLKFMKNAMYKKSEVQFRFEVIRLPDEKVGNGTYKNWKITSHKVYFDVDEMKADARQVDTQKISERVFYE